MIALARTLRDRWLGGTRPSTSGKGGILYGGDARPSCTVSVRRGHYVRGYDDHGHWTATWTPTEDYVEVPGVRQVELEQGYDSNGLATATVDVANVYMREVAGALGLSYHQIERGWFSPYRAFVAPMRSRQRGVTANEWEDRFAQKIQVLVEQGYGDQQTRTFTGLLDSANGAARPSTIKLSARDMGQVLVDSHLFGWNIDPKYRDPIVFVDRQYVRRREQSKDPDKRREAKMHRKHSIIIDDLSDLVVTVLRWAGWNRDDMRVQKVGVSLKDPVSFARGQFYMDVIKKCQDVSGFSFWMSAPSADWPNGRPTFAASHAMYPNQTVEEISETKLLTGLDWTYDTAPLAAIIRVRGKDNVQGETLGGDKLKRVMAVYRPPWHTDKRDAAVLRHVIHTEPLYRTAYQCAVAARMIALQEALGMVTANVELPAHPGLELDDLIGITNPSSGLNTRALIARLQSTFTLGEHTSWKQTLGVGLMDTPETIAVLADLHDELKRRDPDDAVSSTARFGYFGYYGARF